MLDRLAFLLMDLAAWITLSTPPREIRTCYLVSKGEGWQMCPHGRGERDMHRFRRDRHDLLFHAHYTDDGWQPARYV